MEKILIALLQSVVSLLALVQAHPEMDPSAREQAFEMSYSVVRYVVHEVGKLNPQPPKLMQPQPLNTPFIFKPGDSIIAKPLLSVGSTIMPPDEKPVVALEKIEIISPMGDKGLGREYFAKENIGNVNPDGTGVSYDERNYIYIGLVLHNNDGTINKDARLEVSATDESQTKTIIGTSAIWRSGDKRIFYYPFEYLFKFSGKHTLTFSSQGVITSIDINVQ